MRRPSVQKLLASGSAWSLAVVFIAALAVRLLGLRLGLPYLHHWDECWVVWSARNMLETHSELPTTYHYGAPLSSLIATVVRVSLWLPLKYHLRYDDVTLRWVGRLVSVLICSTGSLALYFVGRTAPARLGSTHRIGIYSAASYAFAYELVTHSRYAVTDAILASLCAWTLAASAQYLRTCRVAWASLALVAAGAAFGFKVPALTVATIPLLCIVMGAPRKTRRERTTRLALLLSAGPLIVACFLALNPHFIDHWPQAHFDLTRRINQTVEGGFSYCYRRKPGLDHLGSSAWALFAHTLSRSVVVSCWLCTLSLCGIVLAIRHGFIVVTAALAHALLVVTGMSLTAAFLLRNTLVVVPVLCLGCGVALESLPSKLGMLFSWSRKTKLWSVSVTLLPLGLVVLLTVHDSVMNQELSQDSRVRALEWISEQTASGQVTVAFTPSVLTPPEHVSPDIRQRLARPALRFAGQAQDCAALTRLSPDYLVSASKRGPDIPSVPFVQLWSITHCKDYVKVRTFEANPYEATFWVSPTWAGRVSTIVLQRTAGSMMRHE